jgi:hypothetical protein
MEVINLFHFESATMTLRHVTMNGVSEDLENLGISAHRYLQGLRLGRRLLPTDVDMDS